MNLNRRRFIRNMAGLFVAPAVVKADNLMKVWVPPEKKIMVDLARPGSDITTQFNAFIIDGSVYIEYSNETWNTTKEFTDNSVWDLRMGSV